MRQRARLTCLIDDGVLINHSEQNSYRMTAITVVTIAAVLPDTKEALLTNTVGPTVTCRRVTERSAGSDTRKVINSKECLAWSF